MGKKPEDGEKNSANKYCLRLENKKGKKIVANFGCKTLLPAGVSSKRFYPVFNLGSPPFAPPFICENMKHRRRHKD